MITNNNVWNSPVRKITARVGLYEGSTLVGEYRSTDHLKKFTIERVGDESKFFGFGVCQRLNLHLIDTKRELNYGTQHSIKCYLNCGEDLDAFPTFKISEVRRNENTNELSITAYDALFAASAYTFADLMLEAPYTIENVANAIASFLGITAISIVGLPDDYNPFSTSYPTGANLEGTETLRAVLDDIAEATQTIYYIDYNGNLIFKMPDKSGDAVLTIGKADYITLDSETNRRLSDICSATELGDNVITESGIIGTTQYVRDNAFWELREDIVELLNNAIDVVGNFTINQFNCSWRGNPAIEIGDKIALITKDDQTVISYVFDDTIEYEGSLEQKTKWSYSDNDAESVDNPVSLGDVLKKTFAQVDKANQQIDIVAGETAAIKLTNETIQSTVSQLDNNMAEVVSQVNSKVTAEDVSISIQTAMEQGIERVTTTTGFTFNEEGLHINKTDSEITTTITEDGMTVYKQNSEVLVADNLGVRAEDLHATTFLIIGNNSRLEDYESNRTGCFYIGKA